MEKERIKIQHMWVPDSEKTTLRARVCPCTASPWLRCDRAGERLQVAGWPNASTHLHKWHQKFVVKSKNTRRTRLHGDSRGSGRGLTHAAARSAGL